MCVPWYTSGQPKEVDSFHHMGPKNQTQVVRLVSRSLCPLSYSLAQSTISDPPASHFLTSRITELITMTGTLRILGKHSTN